jgi:PhnB protein
MAAKVKAIPEGYHSITPSIVVRDAPKALDFYRRAFDAKERMRMPGPDGKIMHAEIQIGDSLVMLNDEMPEMRSRSPQSLGGSPVSFYVYVEDVDAAFKRAVDAGATPTMPLTDMFWGDRFGSVQDPFGHTWSLAQHVKDMTPEEMMRGQEEFMAQMQPSA